MWPRVELALLLAVATLSALAFCLDTIPRKPQERVVRHGTLFVGHRRRSSNETRRDGAGDAPGYQADQPGAGVGYQLAERKLQKLRPSVQCDDDSMTLRMLGKRVPDLRVERDGARPIPLSQMPSDCGVSVKRARRDVFLVAKYDGCHVTQQGDNYVLPLRLWGAPVKMGCPVATLYLTVSCTPSAMVIQLGVPPESLKIKVNGAWQPLAQACNTCGFTLEAQPGGWIVTAPYTSNCWQTGGPEKLLSVLYSNGELTLTCPVGAATPPPADQVLPPAPPISYPNNPFPYTGPQLWPFYSGYPGASTKNPTTTAPTTDVTVKPPSADEQFWNPNGYGKDWIVYPGYPSAPPTTAPTVGTPSADQQYWSRLPWPPVAYDPSVPTYSQSPPAYAPGSAVRQGLPWMSYPPYLYGSFQKGSLPWQKWQYPFNKMPAPPYMYPSLVPYPYNPYNAAPRNDQGMPQLPSFPMLYPPLAYSPLKQSSRDRGMDPKVTFDEALASRGSRPQFQSQLSPLQVKPGPVKKGGG